MPLSCEHTQHKLIFMTAQCMDQKLKGLATHSHKNYPTFVLIVFVFTFVLIIGTVCYTKQVIFKHNPCYRKATAHVLMSYFHPKKFFDC